MELIVATLTPFSRTGRVDTDALRDHVQFLLSEGVDGFAPTGTSGEFLYLNPKEKLLVHRTVADAAAGAEVIPCIWDPDPRVVTDLAQRAEDNGAAAVFLPPPLYHPIPDRATSAFYTSVRAITDLPVLAYHHPRVGNPIEIELLATLFDEVGVAGMKDSSGDFFRLRRLARAHPDRIWAGGDNLLDRVATVPGIPGFISRFANLWPALTRRILSGASAEDGAELRRRLDLVDRAGGLAAMKYHLGFGLRAPLDWLDPKPLAELPAAGALGG